MTSRGVRRHGGGRVAALLVALALVVLLPVRASAFVPVDPGPWPGAAALAVEQLPPYPLPPDSGHGRRVVYSERTMHVWAVGVHGDVVRDWTVSGRPNWPYAGTYHVFSKALWSRSSVSDVGFQWMVRFAHGHSTNIGFHSIPYDSSGRLIQTVKQLGHPVKGGGCIRSEAKDAEWLYRWAGLGTTVVIR